MIQVQSRLVVADNSGAKVVMCIKVLWWSKRRYASVWDTIIVSVKSAAPRWIIKKKSVQSAVIVRTKKAIRRSDWSYIKADENAVVMVWKDKQPRWTRVFWPVFRELRIAWFQKVVSQAPEVL